MADNTLRWYEANGRDRMGNKILLHAGILPISDPVQAFTEYLQGWQGNTGPVPAFTVCEFEDPYADNNEVTE